MFHNLSKFCLAIFSAVIFTLGQAIAAQPSGEVGTTDLENFTDSETYYGTGTTHTTGLTYDDLTTYSRPVEIEALARSLRNDADLIYEFVTNRIKIIPVYGLQKGALGAYIDRSGTAFDQAHLMVELLREAGYTADYKLGTITLNLTQFSDWLEISDAKSACQMLADGGIPATVNSTTDCSTLTGNVSTVVMGHVWVEVTIGGSDYIFDPAYKEHTFKNSINLSSAMNYSASTFFTNATTSWTTGTDAGVSYVKDVNVANIKTDLDGYADDLLTDLETNHFVADMDDIVGGQDIDQEVLPAAGLRQTSFAYTSSVDETWTGDIPNQYRTTMEIDLSKVGENDTLNVTFYVDEIYGRKLELVPDLTAGDWDDPQSGNFEVFLMVDETKVKEDDGTTTAKFTSTLAANARAGFDLEITIDHPYANASGAYMDRVITQKIDLETHAYIAHGWGFTSPNLLAKMDEEFGGDDAVPGGGTSQNNTKADLATSYMAQYSQMAEINANIGNAIFQSHHIVGVIFTQAEVELVSGDYFIADQTIHMNLDTGFSVNSETSVANDRGAVIHAISATEGALKGSVIAQMLDSPDIASTAARFNWAEGNLTSAKYYLFTPGDEVGTTVDDQMLVEGNSSCLSGCSSPFYINYATTVHDSIKDYLTDGYKVLAINDAFVGPGWELGYPDSGSTRLATLQRGGAFIAFKSDLSEIIHVTPSYQGSHGGGGGAVSVNHEEDFHPELAADIKRARLANTTQTGVNVMNGRAGFSTGEIFTIGSRGFPYGLGVGLQFDEYKGDYTHTWDVSLKTSGSGLEAMGVSHHLRGVPSIVAFFVMQDQYKQDAGSLNRIVMLPFIQNWWADNATNNVVTMETGIAGSQFVRLHDGTFDAPGGANITLAQTNSRAVERLNEGTTNVTDPGNLNQSYDYSTITYKLTLADQTELDFKNFSYVPGGSTSDNDVEETELKLEKITLTYGMDVTVTYGGGITIPPYVQLVGNSIDYYELDFINASDFGSNTTITDNIGTRQLDINAGVITLPEGEEIKVETGGLSAATDARPTVRTTIYKVFTPGRPDATIPIVEYTYDPTNAITSSKDGVALAEEAASDPDPRDPYNYYGVMGHRGEIEDPLLNETTIYLDFDGNLAETLDGLGRSITFTFDALGRMTESEAPEGNKTQLIYNDDHHVTKVTQVPKSGSGLSNRSQEFTYNSTYNTIATSKDFMGETTTFTYGTSLGADGQATKIELPQIGTEWVVNIANTYTADGSLDTTKRGQLGFGFVTEIGYWGSDGDINFIEVDSVGSGRLELKTKFLFNSVGQLTRITDPLNKTAATFTPDENGRNTKIKNAASEATDFTFDPLGQLTDVTRIIDATNNIDEVTEFDTSATGLRLKTTLPDGAEVNYEYDDLDRLLITTDPEGREAKTIYDAAGQVTKQILAFGSVDEIDYATYTYNDNGTLDSVTDAEGNLTEYFYDGFDRLIKTQFPSKTTTGQSSTTDKEEFTYDANNNLLTRKTRKGDTITFEYDEQNRLTKRTPGTQTAIEFTYDNDDDMVTEVRYGDDSYIIALTYDRANRLTKEKHTIGATVREVSYTYDKASRVTNIAYPDSTDYDFTYDTGDRLTLVEDSSGGDIVEYTYGTRSLITNIEYGTATMDTELGYEIDGMLDSIEHDISSSTNDVKFFYDYDLSNKISDAITTKTNHVFVPVDKDTDYTVNGLNQYPTVTVDTVESTLTYDDNGNLTGDGTWTYTYDVENKLLTATDGTLTTNKYDPLGRRYWKKVGSTKTQYFNSGGQVLMEYNNNGSDKFKFLWGPGVDNLIMVWDYAQSSFARQRHPRRDRLGNIILYTQKGGLFLERYTYDAYGKPSNTSPAQPYMYTGRRWDEDTGLYYYRARFYSPTLGRFLQTDPIGYGDGLHMYAYVGNDPMNGTDPSGLQRGARPPERIRPRNPGSGDSSNFSDISAGNIALGLERTITNLIGPGNLDGGNYSGSVGGPLEFALATYTTFVSKTGITGFPTYNFIGSGGGQGALGFFHLIVIPSTVKISRKRNGSGGFLTVSIGRFYSGGNYIISGRVTAITTSDDGSGTVTVDVDVPRPGSKIPQRVTIHIPFPAPPAPEEEDDDDNDDEEQN